MWSGPRNISTAMMRSFENREDTVVWDEPLYGYYLQASGSDHPGREEIISAWGDDWRELTAKMVGPAPGAAAVWYQKHMTHHLLDDVGRDWLTHLVHCFLIREPRRVLASYRRTRESVTVQDLGFRQQTEIFQRICDRDGVAPPVLDAKQVLQNPRGALQALCEGIGISFSDRMLSWPAGRRDSDGVWGPYWYDNVWKSTGFGPYQDTPVDVPDNLQHIVEQCEPYYHEMYSYRLSVLHSQDNSNDNSTDNTTDIK